MRTYIYPYSPLQFVLQTLVYQEHIIVRTFRLSGGALNQSYLLSRNEAQQLLNSHVTPLIPSRATPENSWMSRETLEGTWVGGPEGSGVGSFVQEVSQISFNLDASILGVVAMSEHAEWIIPCNADGRLATPVNRTLLTWSARSHKTTIYQNLQKSTALTVMMPYADTNFNRAIIFAKMNPAYGLVKNFSNPSVVSPDGISFDGYKTLSRVDDIWPDLKVSGPETIASESTISCTVSLHDPDTAFLLEESGMRIEMEASAGYLAHRILSLQNGIATFSLSALGLSPGDKIKLKAGWRNYPGAAEKIITVV